MGIIGFILLIIGASGMDSDGKGIVIAITMVLCGTTLITLDIIRPNVKRLVRQTLITLAERIR